jgi:hypothetical protein
MPVLTSFVAEGLERRELCVDLLLDGDHHRARVIDPEVRGLLNRVLLESLVQRQQQVIAGTGDLPLVGVGHRYAPALVQGLDALEWCSTEVVHDHEHRARRPVIPDVVGTESFTDLSRALGANAVAASPAAALFVVVHLSAEHRTTDDADDNLLPVTVQLAVTALLAPRADLTGRQGVRDVLRLPIGAGAVAPMPLGLVSVDRVRFVIAPRACLGWRGLVAARLRVG